MGPTNFTDDVDCGSFFDHIDDLIEFPSENEGAGAGGPVGGEGKSFSSLWDEPLPGTDSLFAGNEHLSTDLSAELSVPYEDIVHLEWLSTFVEDSFSGGGLTLGRENAIVKKEFPTNHYQMENHSSLFQMSSPVSVLESSSSTSSSSSSSGGNKAMPLISNQQRGAQRARSKRPRPATFNPRTVMQHLASPPPLLMPTRVFTGSETLAESEAADRFFTNPIVSEPKKKKKKIKFTAPPPPTYSSMEMDQNQDSQPVRKCLHCEITKTPQWRAGPLGPKTLCNACGVRYKSGRLFPEYRPAASPTFVPAVHSNSHKKVLEMRGTVVVNEKGKDGIMSTAPKTYVPAPAPALALFPSPAPAPGPFSVAELEPKLEYM